MYVEEARLDGQSLLRAERKTAPMDPLPGCQPAVRGGI